MDAGTFNAGQLARRRTEQQARQNRIAFDLDLDFALALLLILILERSLPTCRIYCPVRYLRFSLEQFNIK